MQTTTLIKQATPPASLRPAALRPARRVRTLNVAERRVTDLDLEAFIDGQADAQTRRNVEQALQTDSALQHRHQQLSEQQRLLQMWWQQFS